jgi:hypothetical protein
MEVTPDIIESSAFTQLQQKEIHPKASPSGLSTTTSDVRNSEQFRAEDQVS